MKAKLTLKGRALQWLAQREQSRVELRRKLLRVAATEARRRAESESVEAEAAVRAEAVAAAIGDGAGAGLVEVEALLDWLEANRYLSAERFVESRVHARQSRFGNLRIRSELAQHAVELPADVRRELAESETSRATDVLARRFATLPRDAAERARQTRFLAGRGFSPEAIQRVMRRRGRGGERVPGE